MKTYIVIFDALENQTSDLIFLAFVQDYRLEWWRRTALTWILATPDSMSGEFIAQMAHNAYKCETILVLETTISTVHGIFGPAWEGTEPTDWFRRIHDPNFIPAWETKREDNAV